MSSKGDVISGYWYLMSIHMGICRGPIDALVEIRVGDRRAWPVATTTTVPVTDYTPDPDTGGSGWGTTPDTFIDYTGSGA